MQATEAPIPPALTARIWGARGSTPTPGPANAGIGGNTSCVEVLTSANDRFILDAGTGIRNLGVSLASAAAPGSEHDLHLFLTHLHWDHIQGLPFFAPLFHPTSTISIYAAIPAADVKRALALQMSEPYFPVDFHALTARIHFHQLTPSPHRFGAAEITPFALHHPGGAHGYIVTCGGKRIVYATDHEHGNPAADARLLDVSRDADLLLYDAHYTPDEYATHTGWGHSTWSEATRIAAGANVKHLALFHHHPDHSDAEMQTILAAAQREFPATSLAIEGETVTLS
jgi:phosphoribosyl 1,2-cyclic phosphodiesterase